MNWWESATWWERDESVLRRRTDGKGKLFSRQSRGSPVSTEEPRDGQEVGKGRTQQEETGRRSLQRETSRGPSERGERPSEIRERDESYLRPCTQEGPLSGGRRTRGRGGRRWWLQLAFDVRRSKARERTITSQRKGSGGGKFAAVAAVRATEWSRRRDSGREGKPDVWSELSNAKASKARTRRLSWLELCCCQKNETGVLSTRSRRERDSGGGREQGKQARLEDQPF